MAKTTTRKTTAEPATVVESAPVKVSVLDDSIARSKLQHRANGREAIRVKIERGEAFLAANPEKVDRYDIARWLNEAQAIVNRFCPARSAEFSSIEPTGPWGGESPFDCVHIRLAILRHEESVIATD